MNSDLRQLMSLAERVRRGDSAAAANLREQLGPRMVHFVRQALRCDQDVFFLDRHPILAEARRTLADNPHQSPRDEGLVHQVAQRLCDSLGCDKEPAATPNYCPGDTVRV